MAFLLGLGVLGQIVGHLGSHGHKPADPATQTNPNAPTFGNVLNGQLDALGASDPLARLTALVQNGTPISTVIDRLAAKLAGKNAAVANSIKSALSPPSNAPPGMTAAQQVAALARRLQSWLSGVGGGADQRVGQQSDTSGQILDANRARELPAQNDPESASSQLDASALARSLLAQVAASFGPLQSAQGAPAATPLSSSSAHEAVSAFSDFAKATASQVSSFARLQAGQVADASSTDPGSQTQNATGVSPDSGQPDSAGLLVRMLTRAAGVDARFNAAAIATALETRNMHAASRASGVSAGAAFEPTTPAGRIAALLGDAVAGAAASNGGGELDDNAGSRFSGNGVAGDANAVSAKATAERSDALAFAVPAASSAFEHAQASTAASASSGASVDPSAIMEQVVKGMSLRTQSDGTSEVRLRLVPEQLGAVTMRLTVEGSNVSATALAQNADVRNALIAHQHTLARSLADAGLKLTGFTVNLSGGDAGNDRNRDRTSGFGRHYAVHEVTAAGRTDATESSFGGPALLPESTLALFNYLA